jgi:hypothetical protein
VIRHVVLFNVRDDEKAIDASIEALNKIPGNVPEAVNFTVGRNLCERDQAYGLCVVVDFADMAACDRYLIHPVHVAAVNLMKELGVVKSKAIVDFEM